MNNDNVLQGIPGQLPEELEQILLGNDQLTIKRIVSKGHSSPVSDWYDQDDNEWVLVLKGEGVLAFEGEDDLHMKEGDYCFIPAHKKHQVKWTDESQHTIWLAIHFPARKEEG